MAESSLKDQGNEFFKSGNYLKAAALYTQAIKLDPSNHTLYRYFFFDKYFTGIFASGICIYRCTHKGLYVCSYCCTFSKIIFARVYSPTNLQSVV